MVTYIPPGGVPGGGLTGGREFIGEPVPGRDDIEL